MQHRCKWIWGGRKGLGHGHGICVANGLAFGSLRILRGGGDDLNPLSSPFVSRCLWNNGGTVGIMWEVAHAAGTNAVILHRPTGGSRSGAECGLTRSAALSASSWRKGPLTWIVLRVLNPRVGAGIRPVHGGGPSPHNHSYRSATFELVWRPHLAPPTG